MIDSTTELHRVHHAADDDDSGRWPIAVALWAWVITGLSLWALFAAALLAVMGAV